MSVDKSKIETAVKMILEAVGEDPNRPGIIDTPARVARMYEEVFEGIQYTNHEIAQMFGKTFSSPDKENRQSAVVMRDISVFSYCEHHMALMYDMTVNVAYIPDGKVLGLSKIARICDMAAKRLQLQERLGEDIAEIISEAAGTKDVGVLITGSHSCMTARGIRNVPARTTTTTFYGKFADDEKLQKLVL